MGKKQHVEGLKIARFLMVLSSISPLFIIWAIRGNNLIPDCWFLGFCTGLVILPNLFLWARYLVAKKNNETKQLVIGKAEDHREHLLVYLFAMLLPFYAADFNNWRDFSAALTALAFILFLFWHLNLHYMNLIFAVFKYRVFTIRAPQDGNPLTGKGSQVLITKRSYLTEGDSVTVYRLSDTVALEVKQ